MSLKIFADLIDEQTKKQIISIHEQEHYKDQKIRIMPDCHLGKGSCIGFTQEMTSSLVNPAFVGVDIGCGVTMMIFKSDKSIDLNYLDKTIKNNIPSGINRNKNSLRYEKYISQDFDKKLKKLCDTITVINYEDVKNSLCSLGGGNHFIEMGYKPKNGEHYYHLTVHSGSRNFGLKVAEHYIKESREKNKEFQKFNLKLREKVEKLKAENRHAEIEDFIKNERKSYFPKNIELIDGNDGYFSDLDIAQNFAYYNRIAMLGEIYELLERDYILEKYDIINSTHNYIDFSGKNPVLRKGAISAKKDEIIIIPFNMRDGIILGKGKGNEDWNCSAPHGAGRVLSRTKANEQLKDSNVNEIMTDVYTTTAQYCIDELPAAYKPVDAILPVITPSLEVLDTIKPIYNFKAK
ncbi:MAG: RtcB family protein [Fusobacteriales bacterium]|nr:RtcB family protein [Fusobacteriales bacterium]